MKNRGKTVIMVLHDINMALSNSDMTAVMKNGRLLGVMPPREAAESGLIRQALGVEAVFDEKTGQYLLFKGENHEKSYN